MKLASRLYIRALVQIARDRTNPEALADPEVAMRFVDGLLAQVGPEQRLHLVQRLAALGRAWKVQLPLPLIMRARRPPQPMRRAGWAEKAEEVFDLADRLDAALAQRRGTPERFAGLALMSAILKGGLLRPEAWPALVEALSGRARLQKSSQTEDMVWLDLELPRSKGRAAQSETVELLRFYPDVTTLALMAKARGASVPGRLTAGRALAMGLDAIGLPPGAVSIDTLHAAGFAHLEDASPVPIPAILLEVARGTIPSFSATERVWTGMLTGSPGAALPDGNGRRRGGDMAANQPGGQGLDVERTQRALIEAVNCIREGARKQTRGPVIAGLQAMLQAGPVPLGRGVGLWSIDLLERRRATSTIRRYAPAMMRDLGGRFGGDDPAHMEPAQIGGLIEDALALIPSRERGYRAARMGQFFGFAAFDPRLDWPEIELEIAGEPSAPRIRTALVAPGQIANALQALRADPVAQVALLLGARGGLRLSDMEALRVGDAEPGRDGMLRIHQTLWGDLKTSSSRRMVPFSALLTDDERRIWDRYLARRMADVRDEVGSVDAPLLSSGKGLLQDGRFDRQAFAAALTSATGLRPHDLRHGALSNLALLLLAPEGQTTILKNLTGWGARQCKALRDRLRARDPWRGMNELARLAGHRDPATTFESYIHICDLALGLHVKEACLPKAQHHVTRALGLNARSMVEVKGRTRKPLPKEREVPPEAMRDRVTRKVPVEKLAHAGENPIPTVELPQIDGATMLRIEAAIRAGRTDYAIQEEFHLPQRVVEALRAAPRLPRFQNRPEGRDRQAVLELAEQVLRHPEARAWAEMTRAAPMRSISFHAPFAADLWLEPIGGLLCCSATLRTDDPARWGDWPNRAGVKVLRKPGRDRLTLTPTSPDGVSGMRLVKTAAALVLRSLLVR